MGVALEHLHALVTTDAHDLLVTEARLDQATDCFMAKVMEVEVFQIDFFNNFINFIYYGLKVFIN